MDADEEEDAPNLMRTSNRVVAISEKKPISSRAWRYLTKLKPAWTRKITMNARDVNNLNTTVELFAAVGVVPRLTIMKHLSSFASGYQEFSVVGESVIRAIVNHTQKMVGIKHFWEGEASLVIDWLTRERNLQLDKNQLKAPWAWFMRQQVEWHQRIQKVERDALERDSWQCELPQFEYKGYTVIPLTTSLELFDEGKEMHHCVSSYSKQCKLGSTLIFSIRKGDLKVATAEISNQKHEYRLNHHPNSNDWQMIQCRGKCNAAVDKDVEAVAKQIAARYRALLASNVSVNELNKNIAEAV